jgi:hypothetical protein
MATEAGMNFEINLSLLCEFFNITEYFGKNKKVALQLTLDPEIFEFVRPYSDANATALASATVIMKDPYIQYHYYKIKQSIPMAKSAYINSMPESPYNVLRIAHYDQVINYVENQTITTVKMGNTKTADVTPHAIIISCTIRSENDHLSRGCMSTRELAHSIIKKITLNNFRRTYMNSAGDSIEYSLDKSMDQKLLYNAHRSWCNGNSPSTQNIYNMAKLYSNDVDSFKKNIQGYFDNTNYSEFLVIDTTSDFNVIEDMPPAVISGNNAFEIVVEFRQAFTGMLTFYLQVPAVIVQTSTGANENYALFPKKVKIS